MTRTTDTGDRCRVCGAPVSLDAWQSLARRAAEAEREATAEARARLAAPGVEPDTADHESWNTEAAR